MHIYKLHHIKTKSIPSLVMYGLRKQELVTWLCFTHCTDKTRKSSHRRKFLGSEGEFQAATSQGKMKQRGEKEQMAQGIHLSLGKGAKFQFKLLYSYDKEKTTSGKRTGFTISAASL